MAHYGWKREEILKMSPAQILFGWASWQVEKIERRADAAWAARVANADKAGWRKIAKELET